MRSDDTIYAQAFATYVEHTDGKEKLASAIRCAFKELRGKRLLDLGAGDGRLTGALADHFERVVAVDKNPKFVQVLGNLRFGPKGQVEAIQGRIESFVPSEPFDLALFSYSATGVSKSLFPAVISQLRRAGIRRFAFCTFDDSCDWARFAAEVHQELGTTLYGGVQHYRSLIEAAQMCPLRRKTVTTRLWGYSLESFYEVLRFFFIDEDFQYEAKKEFVLTVLKKYARWNSLLLRWELGVLEQVLEGTER